MAHLCSRQSDRPPHVLAALFRRLDPGACPFDDQRPFEFRYRAHQVKDEATPRRRRVDVLRKRDEADVTLAELLDHVDQVGQRPAQPVETPDHEHVTRATPRKGLVEARPTARGAGDLIGEDVHAPGAGERPPLEVEVLIVC